MLNYQLSSYYLRFGSKTGQSRPENVGAVVVRLLANLDHQVCAGDLCDCVAVLLIAVGCVLCTAVLMRYFDVDAPTSIRHAEF